MISNERSKVALLFTDQIKFGKQMETSHGRAVMITYDNFNSLFSLMKKCDVDNFITLDEDRCALSFGDKLKDVPKNMYIVGFDPASELTKREFWIKDIETKQLYGAR